MNLRDSGHLAIGRLPGWPRCGKGDRIQASLEGNRGGRRIVVWRNVPKLLRRAGATRALDMAAAIAAMLRSLDQLRDDASGRTSGPGSVSRGAPDMWRVALARGTERWQRNSVRRRVRSVCEVQSAGGHASVLFTNRDGRQTGAPAGFPEEVGPLVGRMLVTLPKEREPALEEHADTR